MDEERFAGVARDVWARVLGCEVADLGDDGVRVLVDPPGLTGYAGHLVFELGGTCVVTTTSAREALVRDAVAGRSPADTFDPSFFATLVTDDWVVLGPSQHHYADRATFRPARLRGDRAPRRIDASDAAAVERLRRAVGEADWGEGGFGHDADVLWGIGQDGELVAMGNMTDFGGHPGDVGVATHPEHRGRGHAAAIASAMTDAALGAMVVVRYRALTTNAPSLRVASKLGFVPYGANYAVRPPR
jgi:RimJ/RimL family protein N-acetyltransferase